MDKIYIGLIFSQLLTFIAYGVVTIGAALLQNITDTKVRNAALANGGALPGAYVTIFSSANITPYVKANQLSFLFQYQWWIIELELVIFLITAGLTLMPKFIVRGRPVALALLSAALPLVMDSMNSLSFLTRHDTAKAVYTDERLNTTYAGLILVFCANICTIIFMGLYAAPAAKAPVTVAANQA